MKLGEPPKDMEGDTEYRGLMVIKTSSKTKARQRKGAISNWKVSSDYDEELKVSLQASTLTQNGTGPEGPVTQRIYWSCKNVAGPTNFSLT